MSCCVGQASLGMHRTVCVVCYAAKDWQGTDSSLMMIEWSKHVGAFIKVLM